MSYLPEERINPPEKIRIPKVVDECCVCNCAITDDCDYYEDGQFYYHYECFKATFTLHEGIG